MSYNKHVSRVSIIILNWNGWEDTLECLESIYQITYPIYDVIVVDNGSEDDSIEKIKMYAEGEIEVKSEFFKNNPSNKPIKIIEYTRADTEFRSSKEKKIENLPSNRKLIIIKNEKNYGFAEGNNIAMRYSLKALDPDYVLLLNNDTVVDREFLGELVKVGEKDEKIGIVGPKILNYYDGKIDFCGGKINWWIGRPYHIKQDYCGKTNFITGCSMLIKKEIFEKGLFFDSFYYLYFEDADLCEKVKRSGYLLEVINKSIVYHKISSSSKKNKKTSDFYIYYFARNRIIFNKRYNTNVLQYSTFLFYQYIIKTIGAYFILDKNHFKSWLMGLGLISENKKLSIPQYITQKKGKIQ